MFSFGWDISLGFQFRFRFRFGFVFALRFGVRFRVRFMVRFWSRQVCAFKMCSLWANNFFKLKKTKILLVKFLSANGLQSFRKSRQH